MTPEQIDHGHNSPSKQEGLVVFIIKRIAATLASIAFLGILLYLIVHPLMLLAVAITMISLLLFLMLYKGFLAAFGEKY